MTLHRGLNLVAKDGGGLFSLTPGSSDPYVKVFLGGALLATTDIVWTKIVNVRDRTLRLGLDTDPRCWTGVSRRDRPSLARLTSFRKDPGLAPPAASDGRRAGVLRSRARR